MLAEQEVRVVPENKEERREMEQKDEALIHRHRTKDFHHFTALANLKYKRILKESKKGNSACQPSENWEISFLR